MGLNEELINAAGRAFQVLESKRRLAGRVLQQLPLRISIARRLIDDFIARTQKL